MKNISFVMLKPDAMEKNLAFAVMMYFERAGIAIDCFDVQTATEERVRRHYAEHFAKYGEGFAQKMLEMFEGKTVVPAVLRGREDVIARVREIVGATQPSEAKLGTIRGDLGAGDSYAKSTAENRVVRNLIHASDSADAVRREIGIWLPDYPLG